MKYTISIILLCFLCISSQAQIENYNFEDYRQANTRFRGLQINPQLASGYNDIQAFSTDNRRASSNISLPLFYFDRINSADKQSSFNLSSISRFNFSDNQNDNTETQRTNLSQFFAFNYLVDTYRDYNTWFVGYELDGTMGIGHSKEELDYSNPLLLSEKTTTLNSNLSLEAGIRLGWGRIENISNAWHSYRILNRLHFIDQMDEQASVEQINAFGQFLDDIKTYRIFDARLRDIALLQYIDGYLKDDLGVQGDNIKYFTELNDMYQFGITANRIKGVKYTVIPGISSQYYLLDSEDEIQPMTIRNEDFGYGPKLEFQYLNARPIKRDWQLNFGGNLRSNYLWTKSSRESQVDTERELTFFTVDAEAFALVAFYPTTRTEWTYSTTASIWEGLSKDDGDWDDMDGQFVWDHVFNYTYFVNPYTNWQLSFRTRYQTEGAFRPLGSGVPNLAISTPEGWDIGLDFTFNHIFY